MPAPESDGFRCVTQADRVKLAGVDSPESNGTHDGAVPLSRRGVAAGGYDAGERVLPRIADVRAKGIRLRIIEYCDPELALNAPTVIMLHDFLANKSSFQDCAELLCDHFRVITMDLPGFGESEKPSPSRFGYTYAAFAEAVLDVSAALNLARMTVVGHGLGGSIALALAARHPAVVENIVLENPHIYRTEWPTSVHVASLPIIGRLAFKQFYGERSFHSMFQSKGGGQDKRSFEDFGSPAARESAHSTLMTMRDTRSLVALLPRVRASGLIIWGREDRYAPVHHARKLARELPGSRLEVMSAGAAPHEELPTEFSRTLLAFHRSQNASPRSVPPGSLRSGSVPPGSPPSSRVPRLTDPSSP
jgi:pimeloyl-ACP methyl ester carboxylesterase